jgi:hypothetical protein
VLRFIPACVGNSFVVCSSDFCIECCIYAYHDFCRFVLLNWNWWMVSEIKVWTCKNGNNRRLEKIAKWRAS